MQARTTVLICSVILLGLSQTAVGQKAYPLPPGMKPATPATQTAPSKTAPTPHTAPITPTVTQTAVPQTTVPQTAAPQTAVPQSAAQSTAAGQTVSQTIPATAGRYESKKEAEKEAEKEAARDASDQAKEASRAAKEKVEDAKREAREKKKAPYSGPTEIIVLKPTPMLDESGHQQLDPDGKPMFNSPVKQLRDKKGHPVFDAKGKPEFETATDLGYDRQGKKIHHPKVKKPKMVPVHIARGTFSVDGVVGKAALNYDIPDLKYIYLYVPGTGAVVVSPAPFPNAKEEKGAFNDRILTVKVGDHILELDSDNTFLGKKPESAYVKIDRNYTMASIFPVVGYGTLRVEPYMWPGAKPQTVLSGTIAPPPLLKGLQPKLLVMPCPKGQVRAIATKAPFGQAAVTPPCVPIPVVKHVSLGNAGAAH